MDVIASDKASLKLLESMLNAYHCPAILVSVNYRILAINQQYRDEFGDVPLGGQSRCYQVSHGYSVPCDEAGESCPLSAVIQSGHKERVLHIHQTPRGKEHVDVEMQPIYNDVGEVLYFVELLKRVSVASPENRNNTLIGASERFNHMLEKVTRVSRKEASVLLLGESGSGKELVATAVHQGSSRVNHALVTLECAGLTDSLFESELFGHVKGSFTGAHNNRTGLVELANGGTLFLDEIGDVPLSMQVKLLRLIETGSFRPVGSSAIKHSDFRLICATHKNLAQMVKNGEFRQDLYYRINVFPIYIPSLRERKEDLPLLIAALLKRISARKEFHLTDSALQRLKRYPFPGNVRELSNLLHRAVILTDTNLIEVNTIDECLDIDNDSYQQQPRDQHDSSSVTASQVSLKRESPWVDLKTAEMRYLSDLMAHYDNDKEQVADIAGISIRSLYRKLESNEFL
ncbi:sigma-54 interaction domain-containing protein [Marinomonas sp. IMCC 4694]|uniref:sigma-54 interaction domain-containing protein n=1 Tax=Marinomonas sp. IMCC 4694 TaxID=2605432 RepID=UPI0011E64462|nr:sigma-54-dependent Fis family transcriptional regulator [Marinomonas sp. IMCC 4694]TYL48120.1 sigma-54-dependent Fis family transcriptional regulator [Marinomonas sp. IMCC 4694]